MARTYFTLVQYDVARGAWFPQFGDYDRETVAFEFDDYRHGNGVPKKFLRIVKHPAGKKNADDAIAAINAKYTDQAARAANLAKVREIAGE